MVKTRAICLAFALSTSMLCADEISVSPIGGISSDAAGIVSPKTSGISADFWGDSLAPKLINLIGSQTHHSLHSVKNFMRRLMLTELTPPKGISQQSDMAIARIDYLLANGDIDPADALLSKIGPITPDLFKRYFNVKLTLGRITEACDPLKNRPSLAQDLSVKIYCMAQFGQWLNAELTLVNGRDLGLLTPERAKLLSLFLDPELEIGDQPQIEDASDNLEFAIREALSLPRSNSLENPSFFVSDLRTHEGWSLRLRAAEKLARGGSISAKQLFTIYAEGRATTSGAIWERVRAIAKFEKSLQAELDCGSLKNAWALMKSAGLATSFSNNYAEKVARQNYPACANIQRDVIFLSKDMEKLLFDLIDTSGQLDAKSAIALQDFTNISGASAEEGILIQSFVTPMRSLNAPAEEILVNLRDIQLGIDARPEEVASAITTLRSAGFEGFSKSLALEYLILRSQDG